MFEDVRIKSGGYVKLKVKKNIYTYHNACNSFPLWDRVGWPSGSTSLLLFSAPERDGLNTVSLLFQLPLKTTHYKNTTVSSRAKIPLCIPNVPLQTTDPL